jgi:hypothetical protein
VLSERVCTASNRRTAWSLCRLVGCVAYWMQGGTSPEVKVERAFKWALITSLTAMIFCLAVWVGLLMFRWMSPKAWSHSDQLAIALAAASLLATVAFGIGSWWAQREPQQATPNSELRGQVISGTFRNNEGITGSNIGRDAHNG